MGQPETPGMQGTKAAWIIAVGLVLAAAIIGAAIVLTRDAAEPPSPQQRSEELADQFPPGTRFNYCEDASDMSCISALMEESLEDARVAMEFYSTANEGAYTTDVNALLEEGFVPPADVEFSIAWVTSDSYCFEVWHPEIGMKHFDATVFAPSDGPCPLEPGT